METVTVAAVQATPEFLDRDATVQKVVRLTKEAAGQGARLIVFPETFIPTYPDWVWRAAAWVRAGNHQYFLGALASALHAYSPKRRAGEEDCDCRIRLARLLARSHVTRI